MGILSDFEYDYLDIEAMEGLKNKIHLTTNNIKNNFVKLPSGFRNVDDAVWAFLITSPEEHSVEESKLQATLDGLDRTIDSFCYEQHLTCAFKKVITLIDSNNKPSGKRIPYAVLNKNEKPYTVVCMLKGSFGGFAISYVYSKISKEPTKSQLLKILYG